MKVHAQMHWRAPYGAASWIGTMITHNGYPVGRVVGEDGECKRTCRLTLDLDENLSFSQDSECYVDFELQDVGSFLALNIYEDMEDE